MDGFELSTNFPNADNVTPSKDAYTDSNINNGTNNNTDPNNNSTTNDKEPINQTNGTTNIIADTTETLTNNNEGVPVTMASASMGGSGMYMSTEGETTSVRSVQSIFKALTTRIKRLEMNQSIALGYLTDLTTRYGEAFAAIHRTLEQVDRTHISLIHAFRAAAETTATQQEKLEKKIRGEVDKRMAHIAANLSRELRVLRETVVTLQAERDSPHWFDLSVALLLGFIIAAFLGNMYSSHESAFSPRIIVHPRRHSISITPSKLDLSAFGSDGDGDDYSSYRTFSEQEDSDPGSYPTTPVKVKKIAPLKKSRSHMDMVRGKVHS